MTTTAIFRNLKQTNFSRNKFSRGSTLEIWDANLHHGDVRPFACPEIACEDVGPLKTLYPLPDCKCLGFEDCRDIVRGFCKDQHFYIDPEEGCLRVATEDELCNGEPNCLAGAPFNKEAPTVEGNCNDEACDVVPISYVTTYVVEHAGVQTESAPSPPSDPVASTGATPNNVVTITPSTGIDDYCVVETRLYRVESTFEDGTDSIPAEGSEYVLVATFPGVFSGTFTDNVSTDQTGYPLTTYEPMAFPAPKGLCGLARTEDGIVVADKCRVYISESGSAQFTWDGVVEVEDEIRAIRTVGNTIFVFTDNYPVKIGYRHNDGIMSVDRQVVDRRLPLCSVKSLSVYGGAVYFASTHSLYRWDTGGYGSDIRSAMTSMLTPEQWKNIGCESVTGEAYEFGYIFSSDKMDYSLMVEWGEDGTDTSAGTHIMPISYINAEAFATDYEGNIVYQQDGNVYCWDWRRCICDESEFDIGDHIIPPLAERCDCCPWRALLYVDNEGKNRFSKMRVEFDERAGSVFVDFYLKRFGKETKITDEPLEVVCVRGFSLPKYCSSQTFCIELTGCGIMHEVRLATSYQELVNSSNNQVEV